MRTVFVSFIDAFGGVERLILALSRYLHGTGQDHEVVCFHQRIDLASFADWPLAVRALGPARHPVAEGLALARHLRRAARPALLFDLKGAFYAAFGAPSGYCLHLTDPPSLLPADVSKEAPTVSRRWPGFRRALRGEAVHRLNRRGARNAATVIAMTHTIADELRALYGVEARVVRPGVRKSSTRRNAGELRLLSVSRLEPNKRLDWILEAVAAIDLPFTLDVVGSGGEEAALKRLAARLGLGSRVVFHGRVDDRALEALYRASSLFLMPAAQGYGLPALEALARNIPVVLHQESGVSEVLAETPWVEVIHRREELAPAIRAILKRLADGTIDRAPPPRVPSEADWAAEVATLCGWT